jgi:hypothetical protein
MTYNKRFDTPFQVGSPAVRCADKNLRMLGNDTQLHIPLFAMTRWQHFTVPTASEKHPIRGRAACRSTDVGIFVRVIVHPGFVLLLKKNAQRQSQGRQAVFHSFVIDCVGEDFKFRCKVQYNVFVHGCIAESFFNTRVPVPPPRSPPSQC